MPFAGTHYLLPSPSVFWELPKAKLSPQTLNCEGHANTLILLAGVPVAVALRRRELLRVASLDGELPSRVSSPGQRAGGWGPFYPTQL